MVWGHCHTSLLWDEFPDEIQGCVDCHDDQAFYESMDGGAGRNIISREDKPILKIHIYFSEDKYLPFLCWKKSSTINLLTSGWLVCQEMVPYPRLSVDLCHEQVIHWAVVTVRSTFPRGSLCCFAHAQPLFLQTHWTNRWLEKKSWLTFIEYIIFSTWFLNILCPFRIVYLHTSSPNFLTSTANPLCNCQKQGRAPFLLQCFSTALYWQAQHCAYCKGEMFEWILSVAAELVFGAKKQYIDNWYRFFTLVSSGLCLFGL